MAQTDGNNPPKTIRRNLRKNGKIIPETKSGQNSNISKKSEGVGLTPIPFPRPPKAKKFFNSAKANKIKAEEKHADKKITEYLEEDPKKKGEIISINSGKHPEEKEKNIEYYFEHHYLWSGYTRYINRSGNLDPKDRIFKIYAFDLEIERTVSFSETEWDEKSLREERISQKKFKSLIKRKREFLKNK